MHPLFTRLWLGVALAKRLLSCSLIALGAMLSLSCGDSVVKGQLMVQLVSEMAIPKDIREISLQVWQRGTRQYSQSFKIGPSADAAPFPASLALIRGSKPEEPVVVRVGAWDKAKVLRLVREVTTTVPVDRVALLTIGLEWLCYDRVVPADLQSVDLNEKELRSDCPRDDKGEPQTCIGGRCVSDKINSDDLPDFIKDGLADVSGGTCFDVAACFQGSSVVNTIKDGQGRCSVDLIQGGKGANIALVLPPMSPGFCSAERCLIPLNGFSEQGWVQSGQYLRLPEEVCKLESEMKIGVAVTTNCPTKTTSVATCVAN